MELKWSPEGDGIFANYIAPLNFLREQIGFLPSTGGEFQPVTRDINSYATLTVSDDGRTLATVQTKATRKVYVVPGSGSQSAQVSAVPSQVRDVLALNWNTSGTLLASDGARFWKMEPTKNPNTAIRLPQRDN